MTPPIITVDSLARAAEGASITIGDEPFRTVSFDGRGSSSSEGALRSRELLASSFTREPRSHVPELSPRSLTWRLARYRYALPAVRAEGETTRARGRTRRADRSVGTHPGLSLEYRRRAGREDRVALVASTPDTNELRSVSRSARRHLESANRLLERASGSGISARRRRFLLRQAASHCSRALAERDWLSAQVDTSDPSIRERLRQFISHSGWRVVSSRVDAALNEYGIIEE